MPVMHPVKTAKFNDNEFPPEDKRPLCLFVGIFAPTYDSTYMVTGFEQAGYRVEVMDYQKIKYESGVEELQSRMVAKAAKDKPELIFLHIQNDNILNTVIVSTLQEIGDVVIYNFDCRLKDQIQWLYDLVPYVKLVCFSNMEDVQNCRDKGYYNTMVLQSSADYDVYKPIENKDAIPNEFKHDIVFIGNRFDNSNMKFPEAKQRTEMVKLLQETYGDRFKAWGMGWDYSRLVNRQEEVMIYNGCKIAITQNNFNRADYQSDRVYRSMGCGALTLMQFFPNVNKYFIKEVAGAWLYDEHEDNPFSMLLSEIDRYLLDEELRHKKAMNGAAFVRAKHSWINRVNEIKIALKNVKTDVIWT